MAEKKGFLNGFKTFILRGNAIDLAVGMVIGAAFTAIVTALVDKVLNPLIGGIFGKPNFDTLLTLTIGVGDNRAEVAFGAVITALVNFLLIGFALYVCVVAPMNKLQEWHEARQAKDQAAKDEAAAKEPSEVELLTEIRDLLAAAKSA